MSDDFFLRYPRQDTSERARLRTTLHEGEYDPTISRYHNPRRRIRFGGLASGCLRLVFIGAICGLVTACIVAYLLMFALK